MNYKSDKTILRVGVIGTIVVALCCVTPILVGLLSVIGLGAWTGNLDYVLLPALAMFFTVAAYGFWKMKY